MNVRKYQQNAENMQQINIERKAKMKESKDPEEKKLIKKEFDAKQDKALVELFMTYGDFLEQKGQYIY